MKLFIALSTLSIASIIHLGLQTTSEKKQVESNRIGYTINDGELIIPEIEKASVNAGENISGIKFKGVEAPRQFKSTDKITFYVGTNPAIQLLTFSIIQLEVEKNKRTAKYNSLSNKKMTSFPTKLTLHSGNTLSGGTNEPLAPGHYTAIFARVQTDGNLAMGSGLRYRHNAITFEVVE
jgi:hypothetical protein